MPTSIWVILKAYASLFNISSLWSITCVAPPTQMPFDFETIHQSIVVLQVVGWGTMNINTLPNGKFFATLGQNIEVVVISLS